LLRGAGLSHDGPTVQCPSLARWLPGRSIRQQILYREWARMSRVGVQGMNQCRSFQDDPDPRVAVAVDATLVALRQAEPTLQIQVVLRIAGNVAAGEEASPEAPHHSGHMLVDRIVVAPKGLEDLVEVGLTPGESVPGEGLGRGDLPDCLDVVSDLLPLGLHQVQALLDPGGQPTQLRLGEPPFFASRFRPIDCRTSSNASAILNPGG
jgi:hypothetical protein